MDKHEFDRAIGEVPPSTVNVDVDAVIAREGRAAWVRWVANPWVATAAAVVAVTVGVAVALMSPGSGGGSLIPGTLPTTEFPSPSTSPAPLGLPRPDLCAGLAQAPERPLAAAQRLTGVLTAAVRSRLQPGARLGPNPGAAPYGPLELYHVLGHDVATGDVPCVGDPGYLMALANVTRFGEKGNILALFQWNGSHDVPECVDPTVAGGQTACQLTTGPGGEVIMATTLAGEGGSTTYRLDVAKPDGTGVILHAENVADTAKKGGPAQSPAPPLTSEQLIEIVLDPGMTLYPRG